MIEKVHIFPPLPERPEPDVVGPASPEKKEKYKKLIVDRFGERHYEQIPEEKRKILEVLEYDKKDYEKKAIKVINDFTNAILSDFGLPAFDIPERNIHIVPNSLFEKIEEDEKTKAVTIAKEQAIVINAEKIINPIGRVSTIFHEMIHLKSYLSLEGYDDNFVKIRRIGLKVYPSRAKTRKFGDYIFFKGLNEAVVSEIQKKYFHYIIVFHGVLPDDIKNWDFSMEARQLKREIAEREKLEIDEIVWVSKDGKDFGVFPYYEQRKVLDYIVDVLYSDNFKEFDSKDDILKLFFKAHFNGKLLSIARLIEKSFGEDSLRVVGMMSHDDPNSARLTLQYLIKHRKKSNR